MTGVIILATFASILVVLTGLYIFLRMKRNTDRGWKSIRIFKTKNYTANEKQGDVLDDEKIAGVSGGGNEEAIIEFDLAVYPKLLRCEKCGREVEREAFMISGRCPDCGCGILKVIKKAI